MTPKQSRCVRCGEWKALAHESKYCRECLAGLVAAYQQIDDTAERAKAQAYYFWESGGANFTEHQCTNVTNARKVMTNGTNCQTHSP